MRESHNDNIAAETISVWAPRLDRDLTPDDSSQILVNVTGFARIVAEWARNEATQIPVADNDNAVGGRGRIHKRNNGQKEGQYNDEAKKADYSQGSS